MSNYSVRVRTRIQGRRMVTVKRGTVLDMMYAAMWRFVDALPDNRVMVFQGSRCLGGDCKNS